MIEPIMPPMKRPTKRRVGMRGSDLMASSSPPPSIALQHSEARRNWPPLPSFLSCRLYSASVLRRLFSSIRFLSLAVICDSADNPEPKRQP